MIRGIKLQGVGNTENQDFELSKEQRNTAIHFIETSGWVPTGKASIFSCMPKFNEPKLWPYFAFVGTILI